MTLSHEPPQVPGTAHCPLCGKENHCAVSLGEPPEHCWCFAPDIQFTEAMKALVPADKRGRSCICADCVSRLAQGLDKDGLAP
ncbi:cysteine-rich CWC family protein [Marinobacter zhejiangensis]|uniref:Cysteine-rich CWC n=1 Tax=Marinobacter zhejiangensis TaxID=488535 RepID=A0A1I4P0L3_9GAMM|nr:Cysteine-rich CWC [Marinobacter zhejiangensis]